MTSKTRSKSLLRAGFDIDPNQLSTNFNKKNQIGFKLKLLENLRNSKKIIEKYEEGLDETINDSPKPEKDTKRAEKLMNYLENFRKRNNSLNPLNSNRDQNEITDRYPSNRTREKSVSSKNIKKYKQINIESNSNYNNQNMINNKEEEDKKNINQHYSTNNLSNNVVSNKLIEDLDSLVEINTDLSSYVNENCSIDEETKLLDVWIDYELSLIENKTCKQHLIRVLYIFYKYYTLEKNVFLNDLANKNYYKLIKLILAITAASLFVIIYIGYDLNIKTHLKKLTAAVSKPLMHTYEIFGIKKLCKNVSVDLVDKYIKFTNKNYKLQKSMIKNPNVLVYMSKEIDNAGLSLKQFAK